MNMDFNSVITAATGSAYYFPGLNINQISDWLPLFSFYDGPILIGPYYAELFPGFETWAAAISASI
jgi:hypothetical protein